MILYKYTSFSTAELIIEDSSIGFSPIDYFNDPFECTYFGFKSVPGELVTANVASEAFRNRFSKNYGVLSLTRSPINPLMWSHYGDSHRGIVIGIDSVKAGFNSESDCVIPCQKGEVVYTSGKQNDRDIPDAEHLLSVGTNRIKFEPEYYNIVKRAFLYKSLQWGYEEEVRVVKNVRSKNSETSDVWNEKVYEGRPLHCLKIPKDAIREVYVGRYAFRNVTHTKSIDEKRFPKIIENWKKQGIKVYFCESEIESWNLNSRDYPNKI